MNKFKIGDKVKIIARKANNPTGTEDYNKPNGDVNKIGIIVEIHLGTLSGIYQIGNTEKPPYLGLFDADDLELVKPKHREEECQEEPLKKKAVSNQPKLKKEDSFILSQEMIDAKEDSDYDWTAGLKIGQNIKITVVESEYYSTDSGKCFYFNTVDPFLPTTGGDALALTAISTPSGYNHFAEMLKYGHSTTYTDMPIKPLTKKDMITSEIKIGDLLILSNPKNEENKGRISEVIQLHPTRVKAINETNGFIKGYEQNITEKYWSLYKNNNSLTPNFMSNILDKFKKLTRTEPAKTYIELAITDDRGNLTSDGRAAFEQHNFEEEATKDSSFHKKCKKILDEQKKESKCS